MEAKDFVQLSLLAMDGEIQGKTKLQKTVYFLGLMTGLQDELGYRPHYYGPYSDDVAAAVAWLKTIGAIDQVSSGIGSTDSSGFEIRRYDFKLSKQGRRFAETTASSHPRVMDRLQEAAVLLKRAGETDYMRMSIAAKTYFMLHKSDGTAREDDLALLARNFGWEVTPEQIQKAYAYLKQLELF